MVFSRLAQRSERLFYKQDVLSSNLRVATNMLLQPGECTLKDWIKEVGMSGRMMCALIAAFRGADADDSPEVKRIIRWIRKQCIKQTNPRSHFMRDTEFVEIKTYIKQSSWEWDRLKSHFYDHFKQALEIIGYYHPDEWVAAKATKAWQDLNEHEALGSESKAELIDRMKDSSPIARGEWVIQDWVLQHPGRIQVALLCALRGSDISTDEEVRRVTRWLRWVTVKNTVPTSHYMLDKEFMSIKGRLQMEPSSWGNLPIHFRHHTREALELVGYLHPDDTIRDRALIAYEDICVKCKGKPEAKDQLLGRMQDVPGQVYEATVQRTNLPQS